MMSDNLSVTHFTFRKLTVDEFESAMYLSLHVFVTCNSSDFDEEGLTNFKRFIYTHAYTRELTIYGAYKQDMLVGVLAVKNAGTHISLFFTDPEFQGLGIGKALFSLLLKDQHPETITVHSSIYAEAVYEKLGFSAVSKAVVKDGLRFVPMRRDRDLEVV